jgi:hypothetical protein
VSDGSEPHAVVGVEKGDQMTRSAGATGGRLLLIFNLQAARADVYLEALGLLFGFIEVIAEHTDYHDQRADHEK